MIIKYTIEVDNLLGGRPENYHDIKETCDAQINIACSELEKALARFKPACNVFLREHKEVGR
jgi:hypothetical protein